MGGRGGGGRMLLTAESVTKCRRFSAVTAAIVNINFTNVPGKHV